MKFHNAAQKACYEKVKKLMVELFGETVVPFQDEPTFGITFGSAYARTFVDPWGENNATISTRAYVVMGVEPTADLLEWLLRENATVRFGSFGMDDYGIFFEHTIVGSTCDETELKSSVQNVMKAANYYDDQIVAKWGGQRAADQKS